MSERGFSTQNLIKTKITNRLDKHLDPKMRVCELGPDPDSKKARTLVTKATGRFFGNAAPLRAKGAHAARST